MLVNWNIQVSKKKPIKIEKEQVFYFSSSQNSGRKNVEYIYGNSGLPNVFNCTNLNIPVR